MMTIVVHVLRTLVPKLVILQGCGVTSTTDWGATPLKIAITVYVTYAIKQLTTRQEYEWKGIDRCL